MESLLRVWDTNSLWDEYGIIDNVKVRRQYFRISVEYVTERYTLSRLLPIFRERTSIS